MSSGYHRLKGPHGIHEVILPDTNSPLRTFFVQCTEVRDFQTADSERAQVHLCKRWADETHPGQISLEDLANFFDVGKSTIEYHLSRPFDFIDGCEVGRIGRPPLLEDEQVSSLRAYIAERMEQRVPCSYDDLLEFLEDEYGVLLNIGSLRNFVARSPDFKTVTGVPLEDSRLFSKPEEIDLYFEKVDEILRTAAIPAAFVINVDESGFNEFVDARETTRVVPADYALNSVPVPITRGEKRATLIGAICGDGHALKPMVVLQRETIEAELLIRGYTTDKVIFARSDKGFVTTKLFTRWGRQALIPELRRRRAELEYDGPALLLLDGFGCHQSTEFVEMLEDENVICVLFPPHTSDQLQPLDLGVFANQKRYQSRITVEPTLNRQTKQVIRMLDSFRCATTPKNVVGAFRKSGLVTFLDDSMRLMIRVDRTHATAVRHFQGEPDDVLEGDKRRVDID